MNRDILITNQTSENIIVNKLSEDIVVSIESGAEINVDILGSGINGKDGVDGLTPIKGVDYFTQSDIDEIVELLDTDKDLNYIHDQIAPSKTWIITHNLGKFPSVTVVDTANNVVVGSIEYISESQLIVSFIAEFSGKAYLN